ncbi:putative Pancreatic lipase-related protein 2 [Hypsibius exemplaris]|uniref:Pancreatic lipase-related protein 2 n=1 Tax=Hypsibius exemplaris TaxID=2072580 RepID=A0A1W0WP63_HYPEX|nr:putative Pancreatic lipase-related protein 2 [Hypsibius exemplaris]
MEVISSLIHLLLILSCIAAHPNNSSSSIIDDNFADGLVLDHPMNVTAPVETDANLDLMLPQMVAAMATYEADQLKKSKGTRALFRSPISGGRQNDSNNVHYNELGWFSIQGTVGNFPRLPESPDYVKTTFHLFTMANQTKPEILDYRSPATVLSSKFRPGKLTVIVIHGFGESARAGWIKDFQEAILKKYSSANFIAVDWEKAAKQPLYHVAASNTQLTAAQIARLLFVINNVTGTLMKDVHLIGFSLGGQVAGLTSGKLIEFGLPRVGRITGLDPAGPMFEGAQPEGRLDKNDADFVQAIHGNGLPLTRGFGINRRVAHRDYYPNGGELQPGCPEGILGAIKERDLSNGVSCNHFRATAYVLEALNHPCRFFAYPCDSFEKYSSGECLTGKAEELDIFGEAAPVNQSLFLVTNAETAYCTNLFRVTVKVAENSPGKKGSLYLRLDSLEEPISVFENTQFSSGKTFQALISGRFTLEDLQRAKIEYKRICGLLPCGGNTHVSVRSIAIEEVGGATPRGITCGSFALLNGKNSAYAVSIKKGRCTVKEV